MARVKLDGQVYNTVRNWQPKEDGNCAEAECPAYREKPTFPISDGLFMGGGGVCSITGRDMDCGDKCYLWLIMAAIEWKQAYG